jgi:hypothetical protein
MANDTSIPPLAKAFRLGYGLGLAICVAWPLALQLMLGTTILAGAASPDGAVRELGYSFTGLTFASALFVTWRWGKVRRTLPQVPEAQRPRLVVRETLLYAAILELSSLYGLAYYALGGLPRFARAFIALTTIMFFIFVPRLQAWREAAGEETP